MEGPWKDSQKARALIPSVFWYAGVYPRVTNGILCRLIVLAIWPIPTLARACGALQVVGVWYMNELHLPTHQTLSGKFVYGEVFDDGGVIWRSFTALACAGKPSNSARRRVVSLSDA